jgi:hypothetical protein
MFKGTLEDTPEMIRRVRVLDQIGLRFVDLTPAQSAAVDSICQLAPLKDDPMILDFVAASDRGALIPLLRQLPESHEITRKIQELSTT